jgi:phosphoglucosamine mutase
VGKFFGTDGVRGLANAKLTPELAFKLGRCGAAVLLAHVTEGQATVLIGRDTRRSGTMLEAALAAGFCSMGVNVIRLGVVPTPTVAWLTRNQAIAGVRPAAGVMISASHNPAPDNGIKFFDANGFKLPDAIEAEIEALIDAEEDHLPRPVGKELGTITEDFSLVEAYVDHVTKLVPEGLDGLRLAVDTGHGAASEIAPFVLRGLGADVKILHDAPDGDNINDGCGSTHLDVLKREVLANSFDLGLAFDGDADRLLAVDHAGNEVDGDHLMLICLKHGLATGRFTSPSVVATVMSNMGFEQALGELGGELVRAKVGDRYVLEEMLRRDVRLGGEQSGHLIFLDDNTTGDGLISALRVLSAIKAAGKPLRDLAAEMQDYPQVLKNVRVGSTQGWQDDATIQREIAAATETLAGNGRILVRASGTEPLIRVMVEGQDAALIHRLADHLCAVIQERLVGAPQPT